MDMDAELDCDNYPSTEPNPLLDTDPDHPVPDTEDNGRRTDPQVLYPTNISGLEIKIEDIPLRATVWAVKAAFAQILHGPEFRDPSTSDDRPINFDIKLERAYNGLPSNGKGALILPDRKVAIQLMRWIRAPGSPGVCIGRAKLYLYDEDKKPPRRWIETLYRTPFVDPREEEKRVRRLGRIDGIRILIDVVQIGTFYRRSQDPPSANRRFSSEFEIQREGTFAGELVCNYSRKTLNVEMGDYVSEDSVLSMVIDVANIRKSALGSEGPNGPSYLCLDLWAPPRYERFQRLRNYTGDRRKDKTAFRERLSHLNGEHELVAPYAHHLRLVLNGTDAHKNVKKLCDEADIPMPSRANIDVSNRGFYRSSVLDGVRQWMLTFDWPVRFQIEAFLRNGLINTGDLLAIRALIEDLVQRRPSLTPDALRRFSEKLKDKAGNQTVLECFKAEMEKEERDADRLENDDDDLDQDIPRSKGSLKCVHVIVTPTRILLEGPYETQSNRIVRKYYDYRENFVRVEFRDENRLALRWPKEVNGRTIIEQRFGSILKEGLTIAGTHFHFLGYSTSSLREHTSWFMSEFMHPQEGLITAGKIRSDLGDFESCIYQPSKYAARIAQAFSGTDPSVRIGRGHWEFVVDGDLGTKPYEHTDGQGTISLALRDLIWEALTAAWPERLKDILKPSVFQIRFLGFKGIVVVDEALPGIMMRLRPSMKKYEATETDEAEIEIAKAFIKPGPARLCRPLITVLEDREIPKDAFLDILNTAIYNVIKASDTLADTAKTLLRKQDLGYTFGLPGILNTLEKAGMAKKIVPSTMEEVDKKKVIDSKSPPQYVMDNEFIDRVLTCARTFILREFKHEARIPIPAAHQLVGVVDEGPMYIKEGRFREDEVLYLQEGQIFVCVQEPDDPDSVQYIQGTVTISRSPHIHPGDVQVVWAVGKPPDDGRVCFFRNIKNAVVMPSVGERSLASCLAGGDVDGDEFLVIKQESLLPPKHVDPALYDADETIKPRILDRPSTVEDICDFFVEYMQSDVVGLVSDQHLVIADQSRFGTFDRDCMELAKLCSQAVDYPKNGVPVDLEKIPQLHSYEKPDWKKSEDHEGRPGDFYRSDRALGALFRTIEINPYPLSNLPHPDGVPLAAVAGETPLSDSISECLKQAVGDALGRVRNTDTDIDALEPLFRHYARELGYICLTHAPADHLDVRLSEEEIVLGAILAKCSQKGWRKERTYRMRQHAKKLVETIKYSRRLGLGAPRRRDDGEKDGRVKLRNTRPEEEEGGGEDGAGAEMEELAGGADLDLEAPRERLLAALAKGWAAWDFGMRYREVFGARSFGLIGLGVVCDTLDALAKIEANGRVEP